MKTEGFKNIGIGISMLLAGWGIHRFLKKKQNEDTPGTDEFQEAGVKKIKVEEKQLTRDSFYYKNVADQLENELSRRVPLVNYYGYSSEKVFSTVQGLNTDELKQVIKEFGVRSLKLFNLVKMSDGGTLLEWFDNILNEKDLARMRQVFAGTGLWQHLAPGIHPYNAWIKNHLATLKYPHPRMATGKPVYAIYAGKVPFTYLDNAWWDINSWTAKNGKTGDVQLRPHDVYRPMGTITAVYRKANDGDVLLIKVKISHPQLYYSGNTPLVGRELWLIPNRLTDIPYNPNLKGLTETKHPLLCDVL